MKHNSHPQFHIGIYGRSNVGKSSLINSILGQNHAIVSPIAGTTTDPVRKTIELPAIGPVVFIDTAGIDDISELAPQRIKKTFETISQIDLAIIVVTNNEIGECEQQLVEQISDYGTPYFFVHNKSELAPPTPELLNRIKNTFNQDCIPFSCNAPDSNRLCTQIQSNLPKKNLQPKSLLGGLVSYGDVVLLITPIDIEAPEGRLILPQVQTIRDALDNDCVTIVLKEREVDAFLRKTNIKPAIVISDTQVILKADASIPKDIPLTGFSILLAHHKGDFANYLLGTPHINQLKDGDRILMLESCTHHVSCDDIGRVKIPRWISNFTGKQLHFDVVSGLDALPCDITQFAMVIQCGGCMITRKQLINRLKPAIDARIPVSNYGMTIAYVQGVYNRVVAPFTKSQLPELYL